METRLKVMEHVEWCMPLEEEKSPTMNINNIEDEIEVKRKVVSLCLIMPPRKAPRTRTTPATTTTTTSVTNAQLQAMIDQGVTAALAARDANRNGDDSHTSGTGLLVIDVAYAMDLDITENKWTDKYVQGRDEEALEA
ncbi:hypothetical protein Tco_0320112 [Tanacetum coccineum]